MDEIRAARNDKSLEEIFLSVAGEGEFGLADDKPENFEKDSENKENPDKIAADEVTK